MDMDLKEWYIDVEGKKEGPYSCLELRHHPRVTPDTLVWKQGFANWVPLRDVPELNDVFKDPEELDPQIPPATDPSEFQPQTELVIDMNQEPPNYFWILVILLALIYFLIQLYWFS